MLNKKQRITLRSIAVNIKPSVIVGKDGFTDSIMNAISNELFAHELIKVSVLGSTELFGKEKLCELAALLGADIVTAIGRKIVFYKPSLKKGIKHIL